MIYFTGNIKKMYVKGLNEDGTIETESVVLLKDSPFYSNIVGRLISMEYNTFLPTRSEADYFVECLAKAHPNNLSGATCVYADYDNMKSCEVSKKDFKIKKKTYKEKR